MNIGFLEPTAWQHDTLHITFKWDWSAKWLKNVNIDVCQVDIDNVKDQWLFLSVGSTFYHAPTISTFASFEVHLSFKKWNLDIFCIRFFLLLYFWSEFAGRKIYSGLTDLELLEILEPGLFVIGTIRKTLALSLVAILMILEEQEFVPTTGNSREEQFISQGFSF